VNIGNSSFTCIAYFVAVVIIGVGSGRGVLPVLWLRSVGCSLSLTAWTFAF